MIDPAVEGLIPLAEAGEWLESRGCGPTGEGTLYRWASRGLRGRRLEAVRKGGRLYTSAEALGRWLNREDLPDVPAPPVRPARRSKAAIVAAREAIRIFGR